MTEQEMIDMIGTKFTYYFSDGDSIPAIIAAFSMKVGFSCLATSTISTNGDDFSEHLDSDGNLCLIGIPADHENFMKKCIKRLSLIRDNKRYMTDLRAVSTAVSCPF